MNDDQFIEDWRNSTDGRSYLRCILANYYGVSEDVSLSYAIAKMALFSHPDTVSLFSNGSEIVNVFRIVRATPKNLKSTLGKTEGGVDFIFDDNASPNFLFNYVNSFKKVGTGLDRQLNHIWGKPINKKNYDNSWSLDLELKLYTNLANMVCTPIFLAKLTDSDATIKSLLRYRAQELYGNFGQPDLRIIKPDVYEDLPWAEPLPAVNNAIDLLEYGLNQRKKNGSDETLLSVNQIGWLGSNFKPDDSLGKPE